MITAVCNQGAPFIRVSRTVAAICATKALYSDRLADSLLLDIDNLGGNLDLEIKLHNHAAERLTDKAVAYRLQGNQRKARQADGRTRQHLTISNLCRALIEDLGKTKEKLVRRQLGGVVQSVKDAGQSAVSVVQNITTAISSVIK